MSRRILIVEDNRDLADLLKIHLNDLSYEVELVHDGNAGLAAATKTVYDLLILDVMLPGMDGLELCRRLRASVAYVPILMLTSKSSELDRVLGLELGADDYVTKPFSINELLARVKAVFRRADALKAVPAKAVVNTVELHELRISLDKREVTLANLAVELTAKEFDLLAFFAQQPGRVFTRNQLLDQVWGYGHEGYEHTVNSHINRLRAKIEVNPAQPRYILTVWGVGYKFSEGRA